MVPLALEMKALSASARTLACRHSLACMVSRARGRRRRGGGDVLVAAVWFVAAGCNLTLTQRSRRARRWAAQLWPCTPRCRGTCLDEVDDLALHVLGGRPLVRVNEAHGPGHLCLHQGLGLGVCSREQGLAVGSGAQAGVGGVRGMQELAGRQGGSERGGRQAAAHL